VISYRIKAKKESGLESMPIDVNGKKLYSPKEAAEKLSERAGRTITEGDLRQLRLKGRIQGTRSGYNDTVYTDEQLAKADLERRKAGRPKKTQQ
jgi:hypothetical protein